MWQRDGVTETIRSYLDAVDGEQMKKNLFYLSKSPLPFRKLNLTLPGHEKNTLHEADDYLAGQLESWGYQVEREGVQVQAFRRDIEKNPHHQYSRPMPEDPWYTAYNLYAERKGPLEARGDHSAGCPQGLPELDRFARGQRQCDRHGGRARSGSSSGEARFRADDSFPAVQRRAHPLDQRHRRCRRPRSGATTSSPCCNLDGIGVKSPEETAAGKQPCVTGYTESPGDRLAALVGAVNDRFEIGLQHRVVKQDRPGNDDGSFVKAGYKAAIIVIGSWPYADPNYHLETDTPELTDVAAAAKTLQAVLGAVLTLDRE